MLYVCNYILYMVLFASFNVCDRCKTENVVIRKFNFFFLRGMRNSNCNINFELHQINNCQQSLKCLYMSQTIP